MVHPHGDSSSWVVYWLAAGCYVDLARWCARLEKPVGFCFANTRSRSERLAAARGGPKARLDLSKGHFPPQWEKMRHFGAWLGYD